MTIKHLLILFSAIGLFSACTPEDKGEESMDKNKGNNQILVQPEDNGSISEVSVYDSDLTTQE